MSVDKLAGRCEKVKLFRLPLLLVLLAAGRGGRPPLDTGDPASLLLSPTRARIWEIIQKTPGVSVAEVANDMGLAAASIYHHVEKMVKARMIAARTTPDDPKIRLFPADKAPPAPRRRRTWGTETTYRVARVLTQADKLSTGDIARKTGLPERTVQYHLRKLIDAGLVSVEGHPPEYRAREELRDASETRNT